MIVRVDGLIQNYVRDRDMGDYIDDLWERIGDRLTEEGKRPEDMYPGPFEN